jgi:hypothetical protein
VVEPFLNQWAWASVIRLVSLSPFFLIVGVMLWQSGVWERTVIREQLADESEPVITPEKYAGVKRDRRFQSRRIPGYNRRTSAAIVKAQDELAFRKWRVQQLGQSPEKDPLVADWRETVDGAIAKRRSRHPPEPLRAIHYES